MRSAGCLLRGCPADSFIGNLACETLCSIVGSMRTIIFLEAQPPSVLPIVVIVVGTHRHCAGVFHDYTTGDFFAGVTGRLCGEIVRILMDND